MNNKNNSSKNPIPLEKEIWAKIRCWQLMNGVSDYHLADSLKVVERTLRNYDRNAGNLTLEKIGNFLKYAGIDINELLHI